LATHRGKLITFEGGEGVGKSTQIARLADALRRSGVEVLLTREPGGSPGAEEIRQLLVTGATNRWDAVTETLLVFAARRDHLVRQMLPALVDGRWVLCDRFTDSTLAYQGYGMGIERDQIEALHKFVCGFLKPDLTLVLDMPPEEGVARSVARRAAAGETGAAQRYEQLDLKFHNRVREGFLDLAARDKKRYAVIDAAGKLETVERAIRREVSDRLGIALKAA
jgi:dTMP kinase